MSDRYVFVDDPNADPRLPEGATTRAIPVATTTLRQVNITGMTLTQLRELKDIPGSAVIEYEGCGSHQVVLKWEEPIPRTKEQKIAFRKNWDSKVVES